MYIGIKCLLVLALQLSARHSYVRPKPHEPAVDAIAADPGTSNQDLPSSANTPKWDFGSRGRDREVVGMKRQRNDGAYTRASGTQLSKYKSCGMDCSNQREMQSYSPVEARLKSPSSSENVTGAVDMI